MHPFITYVNHDNKQSSDANVDCVVDKLKQKTSYTFQVYAQDQVTKAESPSSKSLTVNIPNFNNLENPGQIEKIEWFYDKDINKIGLFWDAPSFASCAIGYCVYENNQQLFNKLVSEFPIYVDAPKMNSSLKISVMTVLNIPMTNGNMKQVWGEVSKELVIDAAEVDRLKKTRH